jgi:subtilisin
MPVGASAQPPTTVGTYVVVLKPNADRVAAIAQTRAASGTILRDYSHALDGFAARMSQSAAASLEHNPNVLFVNADGALAATAQQPPPPGPISPQFTSFALDRLDGEHSSAKSGDGKGSVTVNVAVLDSGIALDAADLNVVGGTNCAGGNGGFNDPNGHGTMSPGSSLPVTIRSTLSDWSPARISTPCASSTSN